MTDISMDITLPPIQPMKTAPTDGTWVILFGGTLNEQRDRDESRPVVAKFAAHEWFVADFDDGMGLGIWYSNPTGWWPLPETTKDGDHPEG